MIEQQFHGSYVTIFRATLKSGPSPIALLHHFHPVTYQQPLGRRVTTCKGHQQSNPSAFDLLTVSVYRVVEFNSRNLITNICFKFQRLLMKKRNNLMIYCALDQLCIVFCRSL